MRRGLRGLIDRRLDPAGRCDQFPGPVTALAGAMEPFVRLHAERLTADPA